jgi:hypothetical protein
MRTYSVHLGQFTMHPLGEIVLIFFSHSETILRTNLFLHNFFKKHTFNTFYIFCYLFKITPKAFWLRALYLSGKQTRKKSTCWAWKPKEQMSEWVSHLPQRALWALHPEKELSTCIPAPWGGDTGSHKSATGLINRMLSRLFPLNKGQTDHFIKEDPCMWIHSQWKKPT